MGSDLVFAAQGTSDMRTPSLALLDCVAGLLLLNEHGTPRERNDPLSCRIRVRDGSEQHVQRRRRLYVDGWVTTGDTCQVGEGDADE